LIEREVTVGSGELVFEGILRRTVDTRGWVSTDFHNHSTPSGDNTCGTADRIINLAAEHIEFAATTEHNRLYDWTPVIERLKLVPFVKTVSGVELSQKGTHFNSFPFQPKAFSQDNGAPVWNADPRITALTLRDWQGREPDRWLQINHPDMDFEFTDRDRDGRYDGGFTGLQYLVDCIETQNFEPSNLLSDVPVYIRKDYRTGSEIVVWNREFRWLQMLNQGHRYAATAVADAHSVFGNGVGGWRVFLPSGTDDPARIDWREMSRMAKAGRGVLSTGPFLTVRAADGTLPGGETKGSGGVTLHVRVQCPSWFEINRVQVLVNGTKPNTLNFTKGNSPSMFRAGPVVFDEAITVPLMSDAHLIVVAVGEGTTLAKLYGNSDQAKLVPFAYANPIFVDTDSNGFTPNGDTLGFPLASKKPTLAEARSMLGLPQTTPSPSAGSPAPR
jgi:hypothetical protein